MSGLSFLIELQQKISGPAGDAASSLSKLQAQIKQEETELKNLEGWMKRLQGASSVDIEQHRKVQGLIDAKKSSLAGLSEQLATTGGATQEASAASGGMLAQLQATLGPLMAVAAAFAAYVIAVGAAVIAIGRFALAQAGAKRALVNSLQGITGSREAAQGLEEAMSRVAKSTPLANEEVEKLGRSLATAGLRGSAFESSLKGLATVQATVGAEASAKLKSLIEKAGATGSFKASGEQLAGTGIAVSELYAAIAEKMGVGVDKVEGLLKSGKVSVETGVDALNATIQKKFGDVAASQLLDFDTQMTKLQDSIGDLFEDVKIEGFLKGMRSVTSLFDDSTASGSALKLLATKIFDGLFASAERVFPYIRAMMQGLIIGGLKMYIALHPVAKALGLLGNGADGANSTADAMAALGETLAYLVGIAAVVGYVLLWPFIKAGQAIMQVVGAALLLGNAIQGGIGAAVDWLRGLDLAALGTAIVEGLANGITAGAAKVLSAISGVVTGAISAAKGLLDSHSPSRVFTRLGHTVPQGFAGGVEDGVDDVQASIGEMVASPQMARASGSVSVSRGGVTMVFNIVVNGTAELGAEIRRVVTDALEGLASEAAAPIPGVA